MTPEEKKEKARWARIKRVYGLEKEQYDKLNTGSCPICLRDWTDLVRPCVDHDHVSGDVRGIVCLYCNHRLIGRHRDSAVLRRIADYLDRPRRGWIVPKKKRKKNARRPRRKN